MMKKILLGLVVIILLALLALGFFFYSSSKKLVSDVTNTVDKMNEETKTQQQNTTTEEKIVEPTKVVSNKLLTYTNEEEGISIDYPSDWKIQTGIDDITVVSFSSPLQSKADMFQESVSVMIQDFSETGMDLETFDQDNKTVLPLYMENLKITKEEPIEINGEPGKLIIFTGNYPGLDTPNANIQAYTVWDDYAYTISYTGQQGDFEKFLPTVQEMLKSFEF
jgi:serine/threonine-protein kinase